MPPATMTEVSLVQKPTSLDCGDYTLTQKVTEYNVDNNNKTKDLKNQEVDVYDQTLPKNESRIFTPLRRLEKQIGFVTPLRWDNLFIISLFHVVTTVTFLYYIFIGKFPKWQSLLFAYVMGQLAGFGVTAGAHRLWCHRSYKAKLPLQIILVLCYSVAGQNNLFNWVRDHRVHHKFSETSADPHNARRGFFFSHVGWLMMKKHPDVIREGKKMDMSDMTSDPLIRFHTKYFNIFKALLCFILPTLVPVYWWGESWEYAIISQPMVRYMLSLNCTWSVNSLAHMFGNKPYDKFINPSENWFVSIVAIGEGWHNYHHTFPWDYKAAEFGYLLNFTTLFLDGMARIGWAYDLKQASPALIQSVVQKRGENAHKHS